MIEITLDQTHKVDKTQPAFWESGRYLRRFAGQPSRPKSTKLKHRRK